MKYSKRFDCLEELRFFVDFHSNETGLKFSCDQEQKTAWIETEEEICRELEHADLFG